MRPEQLISAGFAITALAAASVPAVGWTLLGAVEQPPVSVQTSYVTPPFQPDAAFAIERADPPA